MYSTTLRRPAGLSGRDTGGTMVGAGTGAMTGAAVAGPIGAVVGAFVGAGMAYFGPGAPRPPSQDELAAAYRTQQLQLERQDATSRQADATAERGKVLRYALIGGGGLLLLGAAAVWIAARSRRQ